MIVVLRLRLCWTNLYRSRIGLDESGDRSGTQRLCERTRIVGKNWNRGWNKVLRFCKSNNCVYIYEILQKEEEKRRRGKGILGTASMMYAINNITIVGGREKRRESLRLIAPRKSGPIGCLSEGPGSGKDQKRVWTSEWRATRWLDGIRLEVKCQTQLRRGFLSTATLIFRWVFSIDELGLRNQDQRVLLYIVSMVIVSILATSGLRPLRITVVVGSIGRSSISWHVSAARRVKHEGTWQVVKVTWRRERRIYANNAKEDESTYVTWDLDPFCPRIYRYVIVKLSDRFPENYVALCKNETFSTGINRSCLWNVSEMTKNAYLSIYNNKF